jgi:acetyltransferase-like isoleucine patch superfamily enzyme
MDELPKGQANKLQRIRFAERTGLQAVNDLAPQILRMFEATCPPRASSLQTEIRQELVHADLQDVMAAIKRLQQPLGIAQCAVVALEGRDPVANVVYVAPCTVDVDEVMKALGGILHDYVMPKEILKLDAIPSDSCKLPVPSCQGKELGFVAPRTKTEATIQAFWEQILERPQVGVETDFFEIGGSSLLAGRLVAQLRRSLGVAMTAASVFSNRTIASMAAASDAMLEAAARDRADDAGVHVVEEHAALEEGNNGVLRWVDRVTEHQQLETKDGWVTNGFEGPGKGLRLKPYSQTAPAALICQALPLVLLYPLRRISTWLIFVAIWMFLQTHYLPVRQTCTASCSCPVVGNHTVLPTPTCSDNSGTCTCQAMDRLGALVLALIFGRLIAYLVFPLLGMAFKWVVIGRYRVGRYPLWGQYYLRWWLVDQVLMICGRGVFRYHPRLLNLYYRMMGARIGARVVIDPRARVGEFDLVAIGTDTAIDNVRVRPFCLDSGCMVLAPLRIGDKVSVARKVHLAPGIEVPDGSALGPNCSTYDLNPFTTRPENRALCAARFPTPGLVPACVGYLLLVATFIAEQVPVLLVLHQMVLYPWYVRHLRSYKDVLIWFLSPGRIGFYIALRVVRRTLCPLVRLAVVMLLKRVVIGRFEEGPWTHSPRKILRRWIMERLMPGERLQEVGHLIGSHYSFMTWTLRGLGAKVGERIYWPGSNFEGLVEYDLLHVEDDVVFGSRSAILCADACEAAPIRIAAGANVSDRCVLLPGCTIGRNAVMGSGSLCAKHTSYAAGSKCVGSKGGKVVVLERGSGEAEMEETLKPFGRAFHLGQAPFCVLPSALHFVINATSRCFASVYHSLTLISVIQLSALIMGWTHLKQHQCTLSELATIMLPLFIVVHNVMAVLALLMAIAIKYVIIGKRRPGVYNWDHSSYCQRWQVYLSATALIRNSYFGNGILDHLNGSAYLVWFFRAHGCHIGRDVCLYPTGADPIMTEPELVQIGDQAAIDDASLIAHINSKGHFSLNSLVVGPRATLRAHSRLLSGAAMMPGSTLLEHTLVLSGDVVDQGETVQGWPAEPVAQFSPFWRVADLPSYDGHRQVPSVLRDSL